MTYLAAVDIGGTFTDAVAVDEAGEVTLAKAFSTPPDFSLGVIDVLTDIADQLGTSLSGLLDATRSFCTARQSPRTRSSTGRSHAAACSQPAGSRTPST